MKKHIYTKENLTQELLEQHDITLTHMIVAHVYTSIENFANGEPYLSDSKDIKSAYVENDLYQIFIKGHMYDYAYSEDEALDVVVDILNGQTY